MALAPYMGPLDRDEFDARVARLRDEGLLVTLEAVEPEFMEHHHRQMRFYGVAALVFVFSVVAMTSVIGTLALQRF